MTSNPKYKKIFIAAFLVCVFALAAWLPLYGRQTLFQHLISSFHTQEEKPAVKDDQQQYAPPSEEVWKEIEKIAVSNGADTMTLEGKISLYDNLDDAGIHEQQHFLLQRAGNDQRFSLETFENIHVDHKLILINHEEKEVITQDVGSIDSLYLALQLLSPKKMRKLLEKDGTQIELLTEGAWKLLHIVPGGRDAVNEYHIYYDPVTYGIKKVKISYSSFPYQDYLENDATPTAANTQNENAPEEKQPDDDPAIEMNITEYVMEYEFVKMEKHNSFNFYDNSFYSLKQEQVSLKSKLAGYKLID